jgi:hypothetical protein
VDLVFCCVVRVFSLFFSYLVWRFTSITSGCVKQLTICVGLIYTDKTSHILMKLMLMFYNGTRSLLILRSNYQFIKEPTGLRKEFGFHSQGNLIFCSETFLESWYNLSSESEVMLWKREMWIHISVETKFFS